MGIITKTASTPEKTKDDRWIDTLLDMVKATAQAIGADYKTIIVSEFDRKYFIPTDIIGYPGIGIFFESSLGAGDYTKNRISCGIYDALPDGISPDTSKTSVNILQSHMGGAITNTLPYSPATCVMMYDEPKDTVLFDIHPGFTLNGTDTDAFPDNVSRRARTSFTLFLAKDVKGGILCGVGAGHIRSIRTLTAKSEISDTVAMRSQKDKMNINFLQLTKMINYLDPSYPEMKSAYVSVIRPYESIKDKPYVSSLYFNGKRWGRTGFTDSWAEQNTNEYPGFPSFFPIEPFVNY